MGAQFCNLAGHRIAYHRWGSGDPVVMVHGITTYSFMWRNIAPLVAREYEVIAIDLLGCGESDKPLDVSYAIKDHAGRLLELATTLELERFHLVGHDLGGGVAQIFAVHHPGLLFDITLINTVAFDYWPVQPITAIRTPIIRQLLMASLDFGTLEMLVRRGVVEQDRVTPELMEMFWKPLTTPEGRKGFLHFAKGIDSRDLLEISDRLSTLELPVLILRGDGDLYLGATGAEQLHATIPGSLFVRLASGGHFIQEDAPEWVAERLLEFYGGERGAGG